MRGARYDLRREMLLPRVSDAGAAEGRCRESVRLLPSSIMRWWYRKILVLPLKSFAFAFLTRSWLLFWKAICSVDLQIPRSAHLVKNDPGLMRNRQCAHRREDCFREAAIRVDERRRQ